MTSKDQKNVFRLNTTQDYGYLWDAQCAIVYVMFYLLICSFITEQQSNEQPLCLLVPCRTATIFLHLDWSAVNTLFNLSQIVICSKQKIWKFAIKNNNYATSTTNIWKKNICHIFFVIILLQMTNCGTQEKYQSSTLISIHCQGKVINIHFLYSYKLLGNC